VTLFEIASVLITLAALFGYLNHRLLRLEPSVGLLVIGLVTSLAVLLLDRLAPGLEMVALVRGYVAGIDFNEALMHGMLGFLLFAGALHVDLGHVTQRKWIIASLATGGLLISTGLVAVLVKGLTLALGLDVSFLACLVFGALISPTDPIAVMGILKTLHAPPSLEAKIAGESLFNDGVAVVVFSGLVMLLGAGAAGAGGHGGHGAGMSAGGLALFFLQEAGGGVALGLLSGYLAYRLMLSIDAYKVEVLITLALVMGTYAVADRLHTSGPIAVVCAGMLIGNRGRTFAMSETVADYLEKFWELIDEILNAVLFLLIGIEVLVLDFGGRHALLALGAIPCVLLARLVSVSVPVTVMRRRRAFSPGVIRILTWAGLRGGISVALVLSLPGIPEKGLLVTATYAVVLFSILVQGLTIKRVLRRLLAEGSAGA
jgi:CPA1 family monovalent cation:H+ antiporter